MDCEWRLVDLQDVEPDVITFYLQIVRRHPFQGHNLGGRIIILIMINLGWNPIIMNMIDNGECLIIMMMIMINLGRCGCKLIFEKSCRIRFPATSSSEYLINL